MPRGIDPYLHHDEDNGTIELGHQEWYEDPGYQMSHNDWCNVIKQYEFNYVEFLEFMHSEKAKPWEDDIKRIFSDRCDIAKPWIDKAALLEQVKKDLLTIIPSNNQSWDKNYKTKVSKVLNKVLSNIDETLPVIWK